MAKDGKAVLWLKVDPNMILAVHEVKAAKRALKSIEICHFWQFLLIFYTLNHVRSYAQGQGSNQGASISIFDL